MRIGWMGMARAPAWVVLGVGLVGCGDSGSGSAGSSSGGASEATAATGPGTTVDLSTGGPTSDTPTGSGTLGETQATTGMTPTTTTGVVTGTEGVTTGPAADMGPACADTCLEGVCVGDVCCPINQACVDTCCGEGDVCSFQQCVTPGADCVDATDCPPDAYCEYTLGEMEKPPMCMGGVSLGTGKCLPTPPECAEGQEPVEGEPITCLPKCEVKPPVDDFGIVLKAAWGGQNTPPYSTDIMMSPIVVQLDDDDCDGKVNEKDIPEIVFSTFTGGGYYKQGTLHAISLKDGAFVDKFTVANVTQPGAGLAAADLDADGVPEIVGCMNPGPAGNSCCDAVAQNTGVIASRPTAPRCGPSRTRPRCTAATRRR